MADVVAVAITNTYRGDTMKYLLESAATNNIKIDILGTTPSFSWLNRLLWFREYLTSLPTDTNPILCFTEAPTVFYTTDIATIKTKFLEFNTDIVWSVEKLYYHQRPADKQFYDDICPTPDSYKYINTGTFIGYRRALLQLFSDISDSDTNNFQTLISHHLASHWAHYNVRLDYNCSLFYVPTLDWNDIDAHIDSTLRVTDTGTVPCIIHVPRKSKYEHILSKLFGYRFT